MGPFRGAYEYLRGTAFHLAEAGVHKAMWELNQPNGWLTYAGESGVELPGGFVDISITPVPADRGVFTNHLTLITTGYLPGASGAMRYPCTIRVIAYKDPRYFAYAIFAEEQVIVGDGTVTVAADSYTSDDGAYGGTNTGTKADVGTNATTSNAVTILLQGEVHGDVHVGADAVVPELCVENEGTITGMIAALEAPNLLPSITSIPPGVTELGDIWLENDEELVLNEGSYHMTDLDVFGNSKITCNGKVVIYLDEGTDGLTPDIRIGGNGMDNTSQIPADLTVYCKDDVVSIDISGNGDFYGGIYAPNADITLNAGDVYGSIVGRVVRFNGATVAFHYDEALRDHANPNALIRSWEVL